MSEQPDNEQLESIIAQHFQIEQTTWGRPRQAFVVRYEGRLTSDSIAAHAALTEALKTHSLTPVFLEDKGSQIIQLIPGLPTPTKSNPWVNLLLFLLTLASVVFAGVLYSYRGPLPSGFAEIFALFIDNISLGLPFALSLLGILLAHEFGHYLAGRYHRTAVTLPYFLPFPFSPFGTLGAFIQLKEPPRNRRELLDIGIAGPLAGLVVAIPILLYGLSLSTLDNIPIFIRPGDGFSLEGNSILYLLAKHITHGQFLPTPLTYDGVSPLLYWLRYLFTGLPTPLGGSDVILHPIAWAGWAGLLVTALNLIPAGQLDGGHILYSLFGKKARRLLPIILLGLAGLGFFWSGWWLWVFLIFMMGSTHAQPLDQITRLNPGRKALAWFGLVVFVLVFAPIPLRVIAGPYFGP
ncbi:MAG: site-2 protease family protein [Chloroflexi bacterium]|nr:site-2 protease family protein [Chloroflexota bacterium]MQC27281.1 site-2 protease family protein [Chloroflexota bacterium]